MHGNSENISITKKNILICPLDWGLGHATRCVPVVQKFIEAGANVIIGADKRPLAFMQKEFPSLKFIRFKGYNIRYPYKGSMTIKMLLSLHKILFGIIREHKYLQKIISKYEIDIVISDNRYGLWSKKAKCIFITHQISIHCPEPLKRFEKLLFKFNKYFIDKYDECWIPDTDKQTKFSGNLSERYNFLKNNSFIGLLSRFNNSSFFNKQNNGYKYDVLCILSGPEPQRTIFENIIIEQIKDNITLKVLIVRGIPEENKAKNISENINLISHLDTKELGLAISESSLVICRSGYSSIMDMLSIGKNAIFVPTPGQTEQEYLATYYYQRNIFYSVVQSKFDFQKALSSSQFYKGYKATCNNNLLDERILPLLN